MLLASSPLAAGPARAQEVSAVLVMPSCAPPWWDEAALRGALAVELRAAGITPVTDGDALGGALSLRIELGVERGTDGCAESTEIVALLRDAGGTASRAIDLADVPSPARARAIAMAVAALVAGPREPVAGALRRADALGSPAAASADATASAASADSAVRVGSDEAPREATAADSSAGAGSEAAPGLRAPAPAAIVTPADSSGRAGSEDARGPRDDAPDDPLVAIELAGTLALAPASATPWGGPRAGVVLRPLRPLALYAAVDALFAGEGDPLGEVRGTWVTGSLGVGLEAVVAPVRVGGRVGLGVGWARLEGFARDASAVARASDDAIATIDVALRGALDLVRELAIILELETRIVALGLDARSPSGSVIALRDAILGARLGIEVRP